MNFTDRPKGTLHMKQDLLVFVTVVTVCLYSLARSNVGYISIFSWLLFSLSFGSLIG